jgi:uncharacterized protein
MRVLQRVITMTTKTSTKKKPAKKASSTKAEAGPLYEIRNSPIHGRGGFALRTIEKGTSIVEYKGDIITWAEVWRRYPDDDETGKQNHTFLFEIDEKRVIDATKRNFPAKWINHSCDPNCRAVGDGDQIFIEAVRTIRRGEELAYDYKITLPERHSAVVKKRYLCLCGTRKCRGTILAAKR